MKRSLQPARAQAEIDNRRELALSFYNGNGDGVRERRDMAVYMGECSAIAALTGVGSCSSER